MRVALLPETVCRTIRSNRLAVLTVVDPIISYELALVRHREAYLSRSGRAWIDIAAKVLRFEPNESFVS
jgi:hypothetical protein